jgi:RNA polymerase sigma-70 factor (ECF subfamily)
VALYYNAPSSVKPPRADLFRTRRRAASFRILDGVALERPGSLTESDSDLLQRCRAGDQSAWRDLVARHTRRVFNVAYRSVGRVDEAEDLTQEVFIKVYQSLDRYRQAEGSFTTWLMTVARNQVIDNYRRRREEKRRRLEDPEILDVMASPEAGPLRELEREERVEFVRRGLRALPADLREPLILCDLQGLPYEEVAGILRIPLGTVKSRINRGRLELARRLLGRRQEYVEQA